MTSQTENSTDCIDAVAYTERYRQSMIPSGQAEDYETLFHSNYMFSHGDNAYVQHMQVHSEIQDQFRRLRASIEAVQRIHAREIETLYRLIEERTLILSDVDEIYNDYC